MAPTLPLLASTFEDSLASGAEVCPWLGKVLSRDFFTCASEFMTEAMYGRRCVWMCSVQPAVQGQRG